ncbi:MAG TPA: AMP-binding protein [Alphaproteobacteria bacterium]|jgi:phenylacetate-CoA ligase|nr:AMP-binding protein [Alphaproteobacteria bacterium]MDP7164777.1 AMP-binding protein [Alphaproteobacteria bacterium]MDP7428266.1 AMP-binding protein [Alphaproteobacteria bacterium]HJM50999.1 AMP-binding protein [Alphaproteobacteria bacterium]
MANDEHYDDLEIRDPAMREADNLKHLQSQVAHAKQNSAYFGKVFADFEAADITDRAALAKLPVTRKHDLIETQPLDPPFGGLNAWPMEKLWHIFQSPGPIYECDADVKDYWRFARGMWAAGFRAGMIVHNTFSYHMTPAGSLIESGARAIGCPVFPGGVGNTEMQVEAMSRLKPAAYAGTPSFLNIILDKADEMGVEPSYSVATVGGEPLPASVRTKIEDRGITCLQGYGTAELGQVSYESKAKDGMIIDEGVLVELVEPGTGNPVAEGEVGEVVVTHLVNQAYPLIRFATGDLSAFMDSPSPCGRSNTRIRGWMGRADQTTKVRGMFVHPPQVGQAVGRHPEIKKARLVIDQADGRDSMVLKCEVAGGGSDDLATAIAASIQTCCKLRGEVEFVEPGSLPEDGKVIDDIRTFD